MIFTQDAAARPGRRLRPFPAAVLLLLAGFLSCAPSRVRADEMGEFLAGVRPQALAAGVSAQTFDTATQGLTPEPSISGKPARQGEFSMKISDYVAKSVTGARIAAGRRQAARQADVLAAVESRTGVPADILLAFWAVESNYGGHAGGIDALRALATHALRDNRAEMFAQEFVCALVMLEKGYAARESLRGSWAGALGQPQFMPCSYLKYAVAFSGGRNADIWASAPDVLASIGNFMQASGWRRGLPPAIEVAVPAGFDWRPVDLDFSQWRALGFSRAGGGALPASGAASLWLPEGAGGPAFLLTENWEVVRLYNISDAYALSVALIAEGIGGGGLVRKFRKDADSLSLNDRVFAQKALAQAGFYQGAADGRLGRKTRMSVHAFQISAGLLPADGFLTRDLLARLRAQ